MEVEIENAITTEVLEPGGKKPPLKPEPDDDLPTDGLTLAPPSMARAVIDGKKTMFVKPRPVDIEAGDYLLLSQRNALGVVQVGQRKQITDKEFAELEPKHLITAKLRAEWSQAQPSWKKAPLYAWTIKVAQKFDEAKETNALLTPSVVATGIQISKANFENDRDEAYKKWQASVNMTAAELKAWDENPASRLASVDADAVIERNLRLLETPRETWDEKDVEDAKRTIAFIARMKGVEQGEPAAKSAPSKRDISLRNWAFDPRKAGDKSVPPISQEPDEEELEKMAPLWGSAGGKKYLAKTICDLMPEHKVYIEPFVGGGAVYWAKKPSEKEIINDLDKEIAWAYQCAKRLNEKDIEALRKYNWTSTAESYAKAKKIKPSNDIERFYRFAFVRWASFYSSESKGRNPMRDGQTSGVLNRLERAAERMKSTTIENRDYAAIIKEYDSKNAFIFLDPPYPGYGQHLGEGDFDEEKFAKVLKTIKGKFLVTYGPKLKLDRYKDFSIRKVVTESVTPRGGTAKKETVLISNFELPKKIMKAEETIEKIKDVKTYDPSKVSDAVLRDDFRIALMWYANWKKDPKGFKHDLETIETLLRKILKEAVRRGPDIIQFNPQGMKPSVRAFFQQVARDIKLPQEMLKALALKPDTDPEGLTNAELKAAHWQLHGMLDKEKKTQAGVKGWSTEDIVNLHVRIVDEMFGRKTKHPAPPDNGLDELSADFEQNATKQPDWHTKPAEKIEKREYATINRSGVKRGKEIKIEEVLEHFKTFKMRKPYIYLVGGLANHGKTDGDIDILVNDMEDAPEWMQDVIRFRLGRCLPPELAERMEVHFDRSRGPFTNFCELYDLAAERVNETNEIKEMRLRDTIEDLELIEKRIGKADEYLVAYSGGKDSLACMIWASQNLPKDKITVLHSATKNSDWPGLINYVKKTVRQCGIKRLEIKETEEEYLEAFFDKDKDWKPEMAVFCRYNTYKTKEITKAFRERKNQNVILIEGSRSEEGQRRRERGSSGRLSNVPSIRVYRPCFDWTEKRVWDYIRENNIEPFGIYKEGAWRFGCWPCPFTSVVNIALVRKLHPELWQKWLRYEKKAKVQGRQMLHGTGSKSSLVTAADAGDKRLPAARERMEALINGKKVEKSLDDTRDAYEIFSCGIDLIEKQQARAAPGKLKAQADKAEKNDEITLGEFFYQPKPTRAAQPEQLQTLENFMALYKERAESWLPCWVQKKFDGCRHSLSVNGDTVKIFSEDGDDNTDRFPQTIEELKALKVDKLVLDAEIERWDGSQHLPREAAAGYINSKNEPDDSEMITNVFDVLYHGEDGDVHKLSTTERLALLKKLGIKQSTMGAPNLKHRLNAAPGIEVDDLEELERAVRRIRKLPGSEGVVCKQSEAPYALSTETQDQWVKYHNATTIGGIVTGREKTKGGVWVYQYGVLPGKEESEETIEVKGTKVVPVGDTFATARDFSDGDGILVEAETVNIERSPKGLRISAWVPRVIGELDRKPDTVDQVARRAARNLVLQQKDIDEEGNITYRPTRKRVAVEKQQDPYMEIPDEDKTYRYTVQHHFRGRSLHSDLRLGLRPNKLLIGWTLNNQIAGAIKEPVTTLAEAKRLDSRENINKISKVNWHTGEWASRPKAGTDKLVRTSLLAERKAAEPWAWMDVEGKTKDPEPDKAPPVGGTRQYPGVFHIVDEGKVEVLAQKPWLHEYAFHGGGLNYRMFFRLLKIAPRKTEKSCEACGKTSYPIGLHWADEDSFPTILCKSCTTEFLEKQGVVLPTSEEQPFKDEAAWLAIYPDDQTPYVLDSDAVKKGWMPPDGISALPEAVRRQIPKEYQYWKSKGAKAKQLRDDLVTAIKKKEAEVDVEAPYTKVQKASLLDADFVLQEQTWRGPVQVRVGPTRTRYWVRVDVGRPSLLTLDLRRNPLDNPEVTTTVDWDRRKGSMELEGDISPGHYLNPTKATPSYMEILDKGKAEVLSLSDDFIKVNFKGKKLKGLIGIKRSNSEWLWSPSQAAPEVEKDTEKRYEFKLGLPIAEVKVQKGNDGKEKRLITGIVLKPNVVDGQGDIISEEVIEKAAHNFVKDYNKRTKMGLMHKVFGDNGIELVESWIAPVAFKLNGRSVKRGSWVMTAHISSDKVWEKIKKGEITGFSIGGVATVAAD